MDRPIGFSALALAHQSASTCMYLTRKAEFQSNAVVVTHFFHNHSSIGRRTGIDTSADDSGWPSSTGLFPGMEERRAERLDILQRYELRYLESGQYKFFEAGDLCKVLPRTAEGNFATN